MRSETGDFFAMFMFLRPYKYQSKCDIPENNKKRHVKTNMADLIFVNHLHMDVKAEGSKRRLRRRY